VLEQGTTPHIQPVRERGCSVAAVANVEFRRAGLNAMRLVPCDTLHTLTVSFLIYARKDWQTDACASMSFSPGMPMGYPFTRLDGALAADLN